MIDTQLAVIIVLSLAGIVFMAMFALAEGITGVKTQAKGRRSCWTAAMFVAVPTYLPFAQLWCDLVDIGAARIETVDLLAINPIAELAAGAGIAIMLVLVVTGCCFKHRPTQEDKERETLHHLVRYSVGYR